MSAKPAAKVTDNVAHPVSPMLGSGPGSLNVMIGSKPAAATQMGNMITSMAGGAIFTLVQHLCPFLLMARVVLDGSTTELINGLQACRLRDTVLEAVGPPNKIVSGEFKLLIGG